MIGNAAVGIVKTTVALLCFLSCCLPPLRAEILQEWTGGTNDVVGGVSYVFRNISHDGSIFLNVEVYETDFSGGFEHVDGIYLNGVSILSRCDPRTDDGGGYFMCLKDYDVTSLLNETGTTLRVNTTATVFVNSYPHKGFALYVRYRLNNQALPTVQPSGYPTFVPSETRPTSIPSQTPSASPTLTPTHSMSPTPNPTHRPSLAPSTSSPTYSRFPTSQPSSQPSGEPTSNPSSSFPTLAPGFLLQWAGGSNNVSAGVSHTFTGMMFNTSSVFLMVEVFNNDFDDDDEFIEAVLVNSVPVVSNCHPPEKAMTRDYFLCALNVRVEDYLNPSPLDLNLTVRTVASSKVNCCPERGYFLWVRYSLSDKAFDTTVPTSVPSAVPTHSTLPTSVPSSSPSAQPSAPPSDSPSPGPSGVPSMLPSSHPSSGPSPVPSSSAPSHGPVFRDVAEFGTNHVTEGAIHTFYGLTGFTEVYARVDVYENDYSDPSTEYITAIMMNDHVISSNCAPGADQADRFHTCLYDVNVAPFVHERTGSLTVRVKSTVKVNTYPHNGYLLYVKVTLSSEMIPTSEPSAAPSGQPTAVPSFQPSTQPSAGPTSRPSGQPSSRPSSLPTTQPSGLPTAQPSSGPTGMPSSPPTGCPTSSVPTSIPTYDYLSPFVWVGDAWGGGNWSDGDNWNKRYAPSNDSDVILQLFNNETISVLESVHVRTLWLGGGGSVDLLNSGTWLRVESMLNFTGGAVISSTNCSDCGVLNVNYTQLGGNDRKYLKNVTLLNTALLEWTGGDVVVSSAVIDNSASGVFHIIPDTEGSSEMRIREDASWYKYQEYQSVVLNAEVNLDYSMPFTQSLRDLSIANGMFTTESKLDLFNLTEEVEMWPLTVTLDKSALAYYAYDVGLPAGNHFVMYNSSLSSLDRDECASACLGSGWCQSFDYYSHSKSCMLSYFKAAAVGGLSAPSLYTQSSSHYELQTPGEDREGAAVSTLLNEGSIVVTASANSSIAIEAFVLLAEHSLLTANGSTTLTLARGGSASSTAVINLCDATLVFETESYNMSSNTVVKSDCGYGTSSVSYDGGHHIASTDIRNVSLVVTSGAFVSHEAAVRSPLSRVVVSNQSTLSWESTSQVEVESVEIVDGGILVVSAINVTSGYVRVDSTSVITASGNGFAQGSGPGAGADHELGAEGGSHSGLGGSAAALNSTGLAYGSTYWPVDRGSGGGTSDYSSTGGAGGGVITLVSSVLHLDGTISSDGSAGVSGGGGGAGGSIAINTTELRGSGLISASGGDGGYSGGLIAGGGGAGGRVAVHVSVSFDFEGCFLLSGGYRPETYDQDVVQAAIGSAYFRLDGEDISAMVFSNQKTCNISDNLVSKLPVAGAAALVGQHRDCTVLDDSSDMGVVDLHIIADVPVLLSSMDAQQTLNISSIVVSPVLSGSAALKVGHLTELNFPEQSLYLEDMELHIFNGTLRSGFNMSLGRDGQLFLYSTLGEDFDFDEMTMNDNGRVSLQNKSISLSGRSLTFRNDSTMVLCQEDAMLSFQLITVHSSEFVGRSGSDCATMSSASVETAPVLSLSSSVSFHVTGLLSLSNIAINNGGQVNLTGATLSLGSAGSFMNYGEIMVSGNSTIAGESDTREYSESSVSCSSPVERYYLTGSEETQFTQSTSARVTAKEGAILAFGVQVLMEGSLEVRSSTVLFQKGGECQNCLVDIDSSGLVRLQGADLFAFADETVHLSGAGSVLVEGVVRYPSSVNATPEVSVTDGCLLLDYNNTYSIDKLTVTGSGSAYVNNSFTQATSIEVIAGGSVYTESAVEVEDLHVEMGTWSVVASNCTITDKMNVTSGYLLGSGNINLLSASNLYFASDGNLTTASYVLEVSIFNFGTVHVLQQTVYWGRAGRLYNFGQIDFETEASYQWLPAVELYSFKKLEDTEMTRWEGIWEIVGDAATPESCAAECLNSDWEVSRQGGLNTVSKESVQCRTFTFNDKLGVCRIHMVSSLTGGSTVDDSARGDIAWDLYSRVSSWVGQYKIINMEAGSINLLSPLSSVNVSIMHDNFGLHSVANGTTLTMNGAFTLGAGGISDVNGTMMIATGGSSILGDFVGQGDVVFVGGRHIIASSLDFSSYSLRLIGGADVSIASNVSVLKGASLVISESSLLFEGAMSMEVQSLVVEDGSRLRTARGVISNFTAGFSEDPSVVSGDLNLNATRLDILGNGSLLEMSAGKLWAVEVIISANASLSCAGRGYDLDTIVASRNMWAGQFDFLGSSGGSHGGIGGSSRIANSWNSSGGYGYVFEPVEWGTPGGGLSTAMGGSAVSSSAGGGAVYLTVSSNLTVDGTVDCGGMWPQSTLAIFEYGSQLTVYNM